MPIMKTILQENKNSEKVFLFTSRHCKNEKKIFRFWQSI